MLFYCSFALSLSPQVDPQLIDQHEDEVHELLHAASNYRLSQYQFLYCQTVWYPAKWYQCCILVVELALLLFLLTHFLRLSSVSLLYFAFFFVFSDQFSMWKLLSAENEQSFFRAAMPKIRQFFRNNFYIEIEHNDILYWLVELLIV